MDFTSDACWFFPLKSLLIKNNKKREAALKNEAGGDEKHFFFTWPYAKEGSIVVFICPLISIMKDQVLEATSMG